MKALDQIREKLNDGHICDGNRGHSYQDCKIILSREVGKDLLGRVTLANEMIQNLLNNLLRSDFEMLSRNELHHVLELIKGQLA